MNHSSFHYKSTGKYGYKTRGWRLPNCTVATMYSAQYGMLLELSEVRMPELRPTIEVLEATRDSSLKQSSADLEYQVLQSRHLLACLKQITGALLLVGV